MAIRDLLWACPLCGIEGALQPVRRAELCQGCGTHFARGRRATIVARTPDHEILALSAAEWLDRLPDIGIEERIRRAESSGGVIHREPARLRLEIGAEPVAFRGVYLNRIERLGPPRAGILQLEIDRIGFHEDGQSDSAGPITWHFDAIRAVQPSSSTLQIRAEQLPLASLQVPGGSIRLWEELLTAALRAYYAARGRGEIIEFQPRIVTR
jgi:hypothetical protein